MGESERWIRICEERDVPPDGGATASVDGRQIAVFHSRRMGRWFACENRCPHWSEEVLARGLLGDAGGRPKVACPLHKRTFSLETGACLSGDVGPVAVFPVKVRGGAVYVALGGEVAGGTDDLSGEEGRR